MGFILGGLAGLNNNYSIRIGLTPANTDRVRKRSLGPRRLARLIVF